MFRLKGTFEKTSLKYLKHSKYSTMIKMIMLATTITIITYYFFFIIIPARHKNLMT